MKPFVFDPLHTDPLDIARRGYLEFFVEKVLDMTGDPKKVTTIQFLIKWLEYDDTHNTWEPWKEVRDFEILHTYLRKNNLTKIIPKKFSNTQKLFIKITAIFVFFLKFIRTYF
jgi:hypothetical protein